jgi:ribose transport system substrate-binding protein
MQVYSHESKKRSGWSRRWCLTGLAVLTCTSLSLAAVGSATASPSVKAHPTTHYLVVPKSQIKIAIVPAGPNSYWAPGPAAVAAAAKRLGVTVSWVVPPNPDFLASIETSTIDSLVAKGYNAFAINPAGESAMTPVYARLTARGIPVIDIAGCTTPPTTALFCFATNVRASAKYEVGVLTKAMGGKGNIAFLTGLLTDPNTILRVKGVSQGVAATNGKVKLVETVSNIDTPSAAPPAVESLLASKGSTLQGMLSTDYYPSVAAASVLTANPSFRHVLFIGQDNSPTVMSAIKNHYIYGTMYQDPYGQIYVAAIWLEMILQKGCTVSPNAPWVKGGSTPRFIDSGYFFVGQPVINKYIGGLESVPTATSAAIAETPKILSCP